MPIAGQSAAGPERTDSDRRRGDLTVERVMDESEKPPATIAACPCCGADSVNGLIQNGREVAGIFEDVRATLWTCVRCTHVFFNPSPGDALLARFYRGVYRHHLSPDEDYNAACAYQREHLDTIERVRRRYQGASTGFRLHDASCGYGGLVQLLGERG